MEPIHESEQHEVYVGLTKEPRRGSIINKFLEKARKSIDLSRRDSGFSTDYTQDSSSESDQPAPSVDGSDEVEATGNNGYQMKQSSGYYEESQKKSSKITVFEVHDADRKGHIESFVIIDCDGSNESLPKSDDSNKKLHLEKYLQSLDNHRRDSGFDTGLLRDSQSESDCTHSNEREIETITADVQAKEEGSVEVKIPYEVIIVTEDVDTTAATDNQVFIQIIGEKGESEKLEFKLQDMKEEPQEKGMKHKTVIEAKDVGKVKHARLTHINKDNGLYRWYLGSIQLKASGDVSYFRLNQWLEQWNGDLTIELTSNPKNTIDAWKMEFKPSEHGAMSQELRSISTMKRCLDETTAAYKLLCRAEEILVSEPFLKKKEASCQYLLSVDLLDDHFEERMEELAIDMAEREDERNVDMMQFERAGLPPEEQEMIPKLDETNNQCYKYLREHGNMWQYDPAKIHPYMKARLYRRFDTFDKDSDGTMTIDEVLTWADRMRSVCETDDEEVESIREALRCYFTMYGLGDDGLCRENWVEAHVTMGEAAKEREKQDDPIPMVFMANAYFDVIDEDDNGILNMQELKNMMNVFRVPEEAAYTFFEAADVSKDGELDKEEMHKLFYKFWFGEYDSDLDGIFAYKY